MRQIVGPACLAVLMAVSSLAMAETAPEDSAWNSSGESGIETVTLKQCISDALQRNHSIHAAQGAVEEAQAKLKSVRGNFGPSLTVDGNVMVWDRETKASFTSGDSGFDISLLPAPSTPYELIIYGMMQGFSQPVVVQERVTSQLSVTLAQPLTPLWAVYKGYKLAELGIDVARLQKEEAERNVAFNVVSAYLGVLQAQSVLGAVTESVARVKEQLERMKKLQEQELVAPPDVLKVEVALAQVEQTELSLRNAVELARANLAVQIGYGATRAVQPAPLTVPDPTRPDRSVDELVESAQANRTELRMVRESMKQVQLAKDATIQEFVPTVVAMGSFVHAEGSSFREEDSWFVGLNLSWPIWQWGASYYKLDEIDAGKRRIEAAYRQALDFVWLEIRKAHLDSSFAVDELRVAQRGIEQAQENFRMQKALFDVEYATTSDLLDAEAALLQAKGQYEVVFWKAVLARVSLERAAGVPPSKWVDVQ